MTLFCRNWCVLCCAAAGAGFLCPNARFCRSAIERSCRLRAGLSVLGTGSNYLGLNARTCGCATEPPCHVLASLTVPGTESTSPGPNVRIYRGGTEPPCRVLADLRVPGAVYRCRPAMHYWRRGRVVAATSAKPRERNAILTSSVIIRPV